MIRARFNVNAEDPRPVTWPINHPYWVTGETWDGDGNNVSVIVAYADDENEIRRLWPDAQDIDSVPRDSYFFSDRFPVPEWFKERAR